jgi:hypothetical protein
MSEYVPYIDPSKAFPGYDTTALNLWMEARGEGIQGMQAVANVVEVRSILLHTSLDAQVVRKGQFSWTNPNDPQHTRRPDDNLATQADRNAWAIAMNLAANAKAHTLANIVKKATLYYNPDGLVGSYDAPLQRFMLPNGRVVNFPGTWRRSAVQYTVTIGKHIFFREV